MLSTDRCAAPCRSLPSRRKPPERPSEETEYLDDTFVEGERIALEKEGMYVRGKYPDPPEHHLLPQEHRGWFAERGVDVDDFTIQLSEGEHQALHGGGDWRLAREAWEGEWNTEMMRRMAEAEAKTGRKLTSDEIEVLMLDMADDYGVGDIPIKRYSRAPDK